MKKFRIPYSLLWGLPQIVSDLSQYQRYYKESSFKNKLLRVLASIGKAAANEMLSLYYLVKDKDTNLSLKEKAMVIGALGYFVFPMDLIPDVFLAAVGFSDDIAVAMLVLNILKKKITPEIQEKARKKTNELFSCRQNSSKIIPESVE